jgi:DNA (cytosine-5)-methyltransferase 1
VIPLIDIFAGPGGLGEGFCSLLNADGNRTFKIALSVEKDKYAHETLRLRNFFRQFRPDQVPQNYYEFVKGNISLAELYKRHPEEASEASSEAWHATLGESKEAVSNAEVDERIRQALNGEKNWLLIGGPPCQAYSVVGRVRRQENILNEETDERVGLYKQYLRILAIHNPSVFVMENVKGLLSATTKMDSVFTKILADLSDPVKAYLNDFTQDAVQLKCPGYKIFSLVSEPIEWDDNGNPIFEQRQFLIESEKYGIPQTRHRVILLGIRKDLDHIPSTLRVSDEVSIAKVLSGLPRLRSKLSRRKDNITEWKDAIRSIMKGSVLKGVHSDIRKEIYKQAANLTNPINETGGEYITNQNITCEYKPNWFIDKKLNGISNHTARGHMKDDLLRYFFIACFGKINGFSPQLEDFPSALLPNHQNVYTSEGNITRKFADRFRVQVKNRPSKTITSHISQDGHYYIHFDPLQCRSFTVREAARIQTFPDNYYFCGPRTAQFIQVGNAVPPLLAQKIGKIVSDIFISIKIPRRISFKKVSLIEND